jgi:Xaa-Pro aminopeptidase
MTEQMSRVKRFRDEMRKSDVDCTLVFSFHNSYYLSGVPIDPWGKYAVTIIPLEGDPVFIVPFIDKERAEENSWIKDVRTYATIEAPPLTEALKLTKDFLVERGLDKGKIGIEIENDYDRLPYAVYLALKKELPDVELVDVSRILERLRLVLSKEEVRMLRIAGEIGVVGMKTLVNAAREGISEKELAAKAFFAMEKELARKYPWCETINGGRSYFRVNFGRKTIRVHGEGTGKSKLKMGDLIQANAIPIINGYMASLERTIVFGKPSDKQKKAFEAMIEAREKGISMFEPGVKCSNIYRATKHATEMVGYGAYMRHTMGHCHGVIYPFGGWLRIGNITLYDHTPLVEGMVISMLLGIYVPELGGFRHGDMFLITKNGHETLTDYNRGITTI